MKKFILIMISAIFIISGCQNKYEEIEEENQNNKWEKRNYMHVKSKNNFLEGKSVSSLTGIYVDSEIANRRPIAVTINNLHKALPQSGIGEADLYYEVLAEGEITRIVAIFENFNSQKIGPVRSAREYFTYFALDNDAIYIHHGGSPTGYSAIRNRGVDDLDGMNDTTAFLRDKKRANTPGMYEHSSYIDTEGILKSIENRGYRQERNNTMPMFSFSEENKVLTDGINAIDLKIPFSSYQISEFKYNSDTGKYERYQSGEPQIDEETSEILTVKNIIVQYANTYVIDGEGRREIDLIGSGEGYFVTNGKAINLTWKKEKYNTPTKWYDSLGNQLEINKGKTWICVYPTNQEDISFE